MAVREPHSPTLRPFAVPKVPPVACPIHASLGVLGRKWALLVLRDVAFYENVRFSDMLRSTPGLTPRVLTFRLQELRKEGFIRRVERDGAIVYEPTEKGRDAIPILAAFTSFGFKHHAATVFPDGIPRDIGAVLPGSQRELLGGLCDYARHAPRAEPPARSRGRGRRAPTDGAAER